jgi:gamma-glutamylcyclotransferase (GGCT)/AIG2-like uncharacterized protein YtfP/ketosteroid isomerase-like protein
VTARLATYGTLSPGEVNHHQLAGLPGRWRRGTVRGWLDRAGWAAPLGYRGLVLDPGGPAVEVHLFESEALPAHWARLDEFEGADYRRVITRVWLSDGAEVDASIYVLANPVAPAMTTNKATVEKYIDGFRASDHALILSCLTDDVVWDMPGAFHLVGKDAFDKEIENEAFVGSPTITVSRMTEEHDVVVAEGVVRTQRKTGELLNGRFCDVFVMRGGKISQVITYFVEIGTS